MGRRTGCEENGKCVFLMTPFDSNYYLPLPSSRVSPCLKAEVEEGGNESGEDKNSKGKEEEEDSHR